MSTAPPLSEKPHGLGELFHFDNSADREISAFTRSSLPFLDVSDGWHTGGSRCSILQVSRSGDPGSSMSAMGKETMLNLRTGRKKTVTSLAPQLRSVMEGIVRGISWPLSRGSKVKSSGRSFEVVQTWVCIFCFIGCSALCVHCFLQTCILNVEIVSWYPMPSFLSPTSIDKTCIPPSFHHICLHDTS